MTAESRENPTPASASSAGTLSSSRTQDLSADASADEGARNVRPSAPCVRNGGLGPLEDWAPTVLDHLNATLSRESSPLARLLGQPAVLYARPLGNGGPLPHEQIDQLREIASRAGLNVIAGGVVLTPRGHRPLWRDLEYARREIEAAGWRIEFPMIPGPTQQTQRLGGCQ